MKRILLVLLVFAVAGGLFAEIDFWGRAASGIEVAIEDDTTFHVYNNVDRGGMYSFEFEASYTTANELAGGTGGLEIVDGEISGWGASVWFTPLDILTINAGDIGAGFGTPGSVGANKADGGPGISLDIGPFSGLDLSVGIFPAGGEFGETAFGIGARYTSSGVFQVVANLGYDGAGNDGDGSIGVSAGVDILALSAMGLPKLAVDVDVTNLTKLDTAGVVSVGPRIGYKFGDFSGYVRANVGIPVRDGQELNFRAGVQGQYPISSTLTASLAAGYTLKGAIVDTNGSAFAYNAGWGNLPNQSPRDVETSVVGVQPELRFSIDGKTLLLGYGFFTQLGDVSKTKSALYANFVVGF